MLVRRNIYVLTFFALALISCNYKQLNSQQSSKALPLVGTWQLITGTVIAGGDTTVTNYDKNISFIKIINDTHFSFLQHDVNKGKDSAAMFVAGGGKYDLKDSTYTEHLEYCSARNWEGNDFVFKIRIKNDTLIQSGFERVKGTKIDRINIEKYCRINK